MPTVKILVDGDALGTLMDRGFNLCLTRDVKVGAKVLKGNVVFAMVPTKGLAPLMELDWEDKHYEVFETTSYKAGTGVTTGTLFIDIKLGQKVTFDMYGRGKVTGEEEPDKPLSIRNDWKEGARVGVRSHDPNTGTYNSLFLSPKIHVKTTSELTPTKKFTIFWSRHLVTDTILDSTGTDPFVFEITGDEIRLKYSTKGWSEV